MRPAASRSRSRSFSVALLATLLGVVGSFAVGATPAAADIDEPEPPAPAAAPDFHPVSPTRVIDTRNDWVMGPLRSGTTRAVPLAPAGVPSTARAVVLTVTAVEPTAETYLTVFPAGTPKPTTSNMNAGPGDVIANQVTVTFPADTPATAISVYNHQGLVSLVVDVQGWYEDVIEEPSDLGDSARLVDTRGGAGTKVAQGGVLPITGLRPNAAAVVNVTAVDATAGSYLTVWTGGTDRPTASNVNVVPGRARANEVVVPTGADGSIQVFNLAGSVHVVVDLIGYLGNQEVAGQPSPARDLVAVEPVRAVDTRSGFGGARIKAGEHRSYAVTGVGTVPWVGVRAVTLNLTVVAPTSSTYLTAWPSGETRPLASNLNAPAGDVRANAVTVAVDEDGRIDVYNHSGDADIVIDVTGWYAADAPVAPLRTARLDDADGHHVELGAEPTTAMFSVPVHTAATANPVVALTPLPIASGATVVVMGPDGASTTSPPVSDTSVLHEPVDLAATGWYRVMVADVPPVVNGRTGLTVWLGTINVVSGVIDATAGVHLALTVPGHQTDVMVTLPEAAELTLSIGDVVGESLEVEVFDDGGTLRSTVQLSEFAPYQSMALEAGDHRVVVRATDPFEHPFTGPVWLSTPRTETTPVVVGAEEASTIATPIPGQLIRVPFEGPAGKKIRATIDDATFTGGSIVGTGGVVGPDHPLPADGPYTYEFRNLDAATASVALRLSVRTGCDALVDGPARSTRPNAC